MNISLSKKNKEIIIDLLFEELNKLEKATINNEIEKERNEKQLKNVLDTLEKFRKV
jgi:hypothetical protein